MSGDPEQEYFSDGITEDLITALSCIRQIRVIARNSTFSYKGKSPNIRQVSEELGARYVIEGSVRIAGNRIRVSAQLIDGETGNHIWAERYDREIADMFDVQDELTNTLVGAIAPGIGGAERQRAKQNPPDNLGVWDLYQHGMWHLHRRTRDGMKEELLKARALFENAIKLDPEFGPAYAAYAVTFFYEALHGIREEDRETALQAAKKAVELDAGDANARIALGRIYRLIRNPDAAEAENRIALGLSPSQADAHYGLGSTLVHAGKAQEAIPYIETAIRLSPHDELIGPFHVRLAAAHLFLGNHEEAAELAQNALRLGGTQWGGCAYLASALGHLGRIEDAIKAIKELKDVQPQATISFVKEHLPITDAGCMDHLLDGLRKAGLPE
jgi:TolB-like protein/tetratricopeptide (TPR) repeat protein